MKKAIFFISFISCMLNAGDKLNTPCISKLFDISSINDTDTKSYLIGLENFNYVQASILSDYFKAKTCEKDFYNYSTLEDMSNFQFTKDYEDLLAASNNEQQYNALIKKYNNCNFKGCK